MVLRPLAEASMNPQSLELSILSFRVYYKHFQRRPGHSVETDSLRQNGTKLRDPDRQSLGLKTHS